AIARRPVRERLLDAPHVVHARVRRAVDLLDVDVDPRGDLGARRALEARLGGRSVLRRAVEGLREDARARRLADPADAREQEGMRDPALRDRVRERSRDVFLPDQVFERLRAPFPREDEIAHRLPWGLWG